MSEVPCRESAKKRECGSVIESFWVLNKYLSMRIKTDNDTGFIAQSQDKWAHEHGVTMNVSRPGKPIDNPFINFFNGSIREININILCFCSIEDGQNKLDNRHR